MAPSGSEQTVPLFGPMHNDSLLDLSFDAIVVRDPHDRIIFWNQGAVETYGFTRDEAQGLVSHELLRTQFPIPLDSINELLNREGRWSGELTHTRKDGVQIVVSSRWSLKRDAQGALVATLESNREITEYRNAFAALRETEQLLRFHFENTPLAVIEWGADFRLTRWSGDAEHMFGWSAAEVLGKRLDDFKWVYEEDLHLVQDVAKGLLDGSRPRSISKNRNYRKDGSVIYCEWYNSSNVNESGRLVSILSLVLDVTERTKTEAALRSSEERFRKIYEHAPTGIAITDIDGHFVQCNRAYETILGYSERELFNKRFNDLIYPEDRESNLVLTNRLIRGEIPFFTVENRYVGKNNKTVWVNKHVSLLPDASGKPAFFVALVSDVSDRKQALAALSESEAKFRTLANSIPQLCWMANPDGWIFWYNDRWYDYTGTTPEQMEGWGWQRVHDPEVLPNVMHRWKEAIASGEPFEMVFPLRGHDGVFRPFLTRISPTKDTAGKVVRWFGTNTDITKQREAEQALVRSEKLASAGRMAATVAHEINNPLEAIMNLLFLARSDKDCPDSIREYVNAAETELNRVSHITRQVLGFYRESTTPKVVSVPEIMDEALELFVRKIKNKNVVLTKQYEGGRVLAVSGELRQVFSNLLANAIDAVPTGGQITLRISSYMHKGQPCMRITVADDGPGIPKSVRAKIFEPFFTTKGTIGTGLGLWVTRQLIEKHSGSIQLRSSTDPHTHGTVFSIILPAATASAETE